MQQETVFRHRRDESHLCNARKDTGGWIGVGDPDENNVFNRLSPSSISVRSALVTGAAGFMGSHLVDILLEEGWNVTRLDDCSTGTRSNLSNAGADVKVIEGDLRDETALKTAIEGVDVVFHYAVAIPVPESIEHPAGTTDVNCISTAKLLETARDEGVDWVILASSAAVYGSNVEISV